VKKAKWKRHCKGADFLAILLREERWMKNTFLTMFKIKKTS
jgi:hypothetical protein